jgi:hemoglobin-like flavoprotein
MGLIKKTKELIKDQIPMSNKQGTNLKVASLEQSFCSMPRLLQNHGKVNDHCES